MGTAPAISSGRGRPERHDRYCAPPPPVAFPHPHPAVLANDPSLEPSPSPPAQRSSGATCAATGDATAFCWPMGTSRAFGPCPPHPLVAVRDGGRRSEFAGAGRPAQERQMGRQCLLARIGAKEPQSAFLQAPFHCRCALRVAPARESLKVHYGARALGPDPSVGMRSSFSTCEREW